MEFRILGPLEVWDGGGEVSLGGPSRVHASRRETERRPERAPPVSYGRLLILRCSVRATRQAGFRDGCCA